MKRLVRIPYRYDPKYRYNLCHRLRLKGFHVDTDTHAINIPIGQDVARLPKTVRRHIYDLVHEYGFVIQTYIPGGNGRVVEPSEGLSGQAAVKFRRTSKRQR